MDLDNFTAQMTSHAGTIHSLTLGISDEQARWRPNSESWSILEVINHLFDEECEDFRVRVDYILHHPGQPWPPINPPGWVSERGYNQRDLMQSVQNFLEERRKSVSWLLGLGKPDWHISATVSFGTFSAGDIFSAWVAHDILHMRQLVELHWAHLLQTAKPFHVNYAGEW